MDGSLFRRLSGTDRAGSARDGVTSGNSLARRDTQEMWFVTAWNRFFEKQIAVKPPEVIHRRIKEGIKG